MPPSALRDAFPGAKRITLEMFGAPGEYGECLFVDVITNTSGDTLVRQYDDYVKRWVEATPPWVTDLMGISTHPE